MDKFTNGSWETYNMAMEEVDNYETTPLDLPPWPYYPHTADANPREEAEAEEEEEEELGAMKEMMFKIAAMQPVDIDPSTIRKPRRRNVRISDDPQSVAARHRRERISEKIRILQRLVPGGTKMDTASMLDEAIRYVKFLKRQIRLLQGGSGGPPNAAAASAFQVNNHGDDLPVCFSGRKFIGD